MRVYKNINGIYYEFYVRGNNMIKDHVIKKLQTHKSVFDMHITEIIAAHRFLLTKVLEK